jgi:hypothetical protein
MTDFGQIIKNLECHISRNNRKGIELCIQQLKDRIVL